MPKAPYRLLAHPLVKYALALLAVSLAALLDALPALAGTVNCPAGTATTPPVTFVHTLVSNFESTLRGFIANARPIARDLLILLIAFELISSATTWGLSRTGLDELIMRLSFKILVWGLILAVISGTGVPSSIFNLEHIVSGFRSLARMVAGTSLPTPYPDVVIGWAFDQSACLLLQANTNGYLLFGLTGFWSLLASLGVILGYTIVAFRLWVAIMNSIIAVATGLVLLGFAGWRGTAGLADGCITWVFSAAIKLFFLDLLLYVSEATLPLVQGELDMVLSTQSLLAFTAAPLVAWFFAGLAIYIPSVAGRFFRRHVNIGIARSISW
jgi:hypothetical protein